MATSITNTSVTTDNLTTDGLTVDTNTIHVDSTNNRVGIGTASPLSELHQDIGLNDREGHYLYYGADAKAGFTVLPVTGEIRIGAATAGTSGNYSTEIMSRNGSNLVTSIKADNYGRVTKPNQPMFSISGGPNSYRDSSNNESVILHGQSGSFPGDMNIGGHFSYSTGRFTAPVAGNYMFTYTLTSGDTGSHFIELRKNNTSLTTVLLYYTQYQSGCHSAIYTLAANDYVTAQRRGTGYGVYSAVFSGFLVG